ncbi:MAG: hypothetical protein ACUVSQ_04400, partial [Pseudanabaenaceae cyanobacterium]
AITRPPALSLGGTRPPPPPPLRDPLAPNCTPCLAQQLAFIDTILARYRPTAVPEAPSTNLAQPLLDLKPRKRTYKFFPDREPPMEPSDVIPLEKSILPGSLFRTLDRVGRNLNDKQYAGYEQEVLSELRQSRQRAIGAIRFCALLLGLTVALQQASKWLIYSPLVESLNRDHPIATRFAPDVERELLEKFRELKDKRELEQLVTGEMAPPGEDAELQKEARRLVHTFHQHRLDGIKNVLADGTAALGFYTFLVANRRQLQILKGFFDETLYSLNDSAKAFVLIVLTDTFVGYHSSDGWEALLLVIGGHYGIAENRWFLMTFIATIPVFLDGLFKYWIFQYLRQSSPATATIFSEMNQ